MKKSILSFYIFLLVFAGACNQYSSNPNLALARDFIDAYYVFADQEKALLLCTGHAAENLKSEIELLKNVSNRQEAYRTRSITFELKQQLHQENTEMYLFELTIKLPQLGERKQLVNIGIDTASNMIKFFDTLK